MQATESQVLGLCVVSCGCNRMAAIPFALFAAAKIIGCHQIHSGAGSPAGSFASEADAEFRRPSPACKAIDSLFLLPINICARRDLHYVTNIWFGGSW